MSSRNRYLSAGGARGRADNLRASSSGARCAIEAGSTDFEALERGGVEALQQAGFRPDYFSIRDAANLGRRARNRARLVILTAARIGRARLIDNVRATKVG